MVCLKSVAMVVTAAACITVPLFAQTELTPEQKTKVEAKLKQYAALGSDPVIVAAVKEANTTPSVEARGMTQEKWKELTLISPEVKSFAKNKLAAYIKEKKGEEVSEGFVNCADGSKAAFLSKTTSWIHKGKPKHDNPMAGKTWVGKIEVDESTGIQAVQIAFPVLDAGKPVGSIVLGLNVSKL